MSSASVRTIERAVGGTDCSLCAVAARHGITRSLPCLAPRGFRAAAAALLCAIVGGPFARADTGREAWLRYAPREQRRASGKYKHQTTKIIRAGDSLVIKTAEDELIRGLRGMLGPDWLASGGLPERILLSGSGQSKAFHPGSPVEEDGFWISTRRCEETDCILIAGGGDRGVLFGVFALLSKIARGENISALNEVQNPGAKIRWVDQWDNLDGSIERGYAGRSIFFEGGNVRADWKRASEYARLLASVGINGCNVNNVNANPRVLQGAFLPQVARLADALRPWGVRLSLSVDLSSPKTVGGLDTFDPLDPKVAAWWSAKAGEIYELIPDFGGFTVKADSEGRVGPSSYGRTPADAANVLARALAPHGGVVFYRAFVYDHHLDWNDPKADRARAAYDIFHPLDGKFDDNAIIQIKHGPIDFQAREPVSPLFGGLEKTNQAIELQVTQEYTGQQRHLVYLAPMWKEVLDFDLNSAETATEPPGARSEEGKTGQITATTDWRLQDLVSGKTFRRPVGGYVAVVNVGADENWLAHPFAMANLYAFGRLAWNPNLTAGEIAEEWARLTFGNDPLVAGIATDIAMNSWHRYQSYTGFLGTQTLTDITGSHYGPNIESSEENGWGQWHRGRSSGNRHGSQRGNRNWIRGAVSACRREDVRVGRDDSRRVAAVLSSPALHACTAFGEDGNSAHLRFSLRGCERGCGSRAPVEDAQGKIDDQRYNDVLHRLEYQTGHAIVWRDAICSYFLRLSGIADAKGRAGNFPNRTEAESMALAGYLPVDVTPRENASNGKAIECRETKGCSASIRYPGTAGKYEVDVEYFDQNNGVSRLRVFVNGRMVDQWVADDHLPAKKAGADSSTRRRIHDVELRPGDEIRIEGIPDGEEHAGLDYVEIFPERE